MSVTVSEFASVTAKSGLARRARSVNNSTAWSAKDSDGTCPFTSPGTIRGSRLVVRIVTQQQPSVADKAQQRLRDRATRLVGESERTVVVTLVTG